MLDINLYVLCCIIIIYKISNYNIRQVSKDNRNLKNEIESN